MITAVEPLIIPLISCIALGLAWLLSVSSVHAPARASSERFLAIDGLRGYLAFFVFLHHSCVWYFYLQTDRWEVPPSNVYVILGQGSVAVFFMVTSFLYTTKILESGSVGVNWFDLYVLRAARIIPLYLVAIGILFIFVAIRSDFKLTSTLGGLLDQLGKWIAFTIGGKPDINGVPKTSIMVASVTWSLAFEWFFYFCLPLLALVMRGAFSTWGVLFSWVAIFSMLEVWTPKGIVLGSFFGGIFAAIMVRHDSVKRFLSGRICSWLVLIVLLVVCQLPTAFDIVALILLSLIFLIVSAGNQLFGVLDNAAARWLGELSYGVYLLHGLVLFLCFHFIIGPDEVRKLTPMSFWLLIALITPFVLLAAHVAHLYIEKPMMGWVKAALYKGRDRTQHGLKKV